jgi:hypothetical protein
VWQGTATADQIERFMSWLKPLSRNKQHHLSRVLENPACPSDVVAQIWKVGVQHRGDDMWLNLAEPALEHQNMPESVLLRLMRDNIRLHNHFIDVGTIIHRNATLPPRVFGVMAGYPEVRVREVAAARRDCPAPVLDLLLRDPDRRVARAAANNPNLPASVRAMWQLASGS